MQEKKISLYNRLNGSDKVYHVQLVASGDGFMVNAQNGRRGGTLTPQVKTKEPVSYDAATKVYDKLVASKLKDGYTASESGIAFIGTDMQARATDMVPQLLNVVTRDEAERLISDPTFIMQQKYDGHRRGIIASEEQLTGTNRKALTVPLLEPIGAALKSISHLWPMKLDGEQVGDIFYAFDIRQIQGMSLDDCSVLERLEHLDKVALALKDSPSVKVVPTFRTSAEKRAAFDHLAAAAKEGAAEGVVFKNVTSTYVPGCPASGGTQLKYKFVNTATVIVTSSHPSRRSVAIHVLDDQGKQLPVGNVTIPSTWDIPADGSFIEVRYLYAFKGGSLFQPVYLGERTDVDETSAVEAKLCYVAQP